MQCVFWYFKWSGKKILSFCHSQTITNLWYIINVFIFFINSNFVYTEDILDEKNPHLLISFSYLSLLPDVLQIIRQVVRHSVTDIHTLIYVYIYIYISSFTTSQFLGNVNSAVLISVWYIFCKVLFQNYHYPNWFNLIEVEFSFKNL